MAQTSPAAVITPATPAVRAAARVGRAMVLVHRQIDLLGGLG